jgi:hypothetical protein
VSFERMGGSRPGALSRAWARFGGVFLRASLLLGALGIGLMSVTIVGARDEMRREPHQFRAALPGGAPALASELLAGRGAAHTRLGLAAAKPLERLSVRFTRSGVQMSADKMRVRLRLDAFGRSGRMNAFGATRPLASANRVVYDHRGIREWYVSRPLGLEQGVDISSPPRAIGGPLIVSVGVSGAAERPVGDSIQIGSGSSALRYGDLSVTDARGRILPAWFTLERHGVAIKVDDRGARYPLRVDPFVQQAELTASDGAMNDGLGQSVALSGDTIVAAGGDRVYVFERKASAPWTTATQAAELSTSDGGEISSVAISGNTIVAGAPIRNTGNGDTESGAVYVFVEPQTGWQNATQTAKLTASDAGVGDLLGESVAISGDTVVAGATGHDVGTNTQQGAAYVFVEPPSGWANGTQTAELTALGGGVLDQLGWSVAISPDGNTITAGAPDHPSGVQSGAVYVYTKPQAGWQIATQTAALTASDGGGALGKSVAVSNNTVVAGAPGHQIQSARGQGVAYVFEEPQTGWVTATQTAELAAPDGAVYLGQQGDMLGSSVAISGNTIVVGSPFHEPGSVTEPGAAYVFVEPTGGWEKATVTQELSASDQTAYDHFGESVAVSGATVVAGAPGHPYTGANSGSGTAYVFDVPPSVTISAPANGATYAQGRLVRAAYSCTAPTGSTVSSCTGTLPDGTPVDTSKPGQHTLTVTGTDSDGETASSTVTYTVTAPSPPPPAAIQLSGFRQSASVWREADKLARMARKRRPPVGTTFSFSVNQPAWIAMSFTRRMSGREVNGRCVSQTLTNRHRRRCVSEVAAGAMTLPAQAGRSHIRFYGRLSPTRKLELGSYVVTVTATSAAGMKATAQPRRFKIVP